MTYSYNVAGKPVELEVDPSVVAVRFGAGPMGAKARSLEELNIGPFADRIDLVGEGLSIVPAGAMAGPLGWSVGDEHAGLIEALREQPAVTDATPVFKIGTTQAVPTDRILLGIAPGEEIEGLLAEYGLRLVSRAEERVVAQIPMGAKVFDLVAAVDADPRTLYAEPDFVMIGRHMPARAGALADTIPFAPSAQYALSITKAEQAWAVQKGDRSILVAVLDEGVDTSHPDLVQATEATYDATDNDSYQQPNSWDGHGTSCAGLAVASPARPGGVAGTGKGCGLLAVRIAFSERRGGPWQTRQETIAAGVDWAWRYEGAAVISNSWGQQLPTNAVTWAIDRARTQGRGGKGCVIVVAAGNSGGEVLFPASLPDVLTVSASNEYDEAKTTTSADNETFWASCNGPEIDVAAPGVHNLTTDITGPGGYAPGNYAPAFNGTSSATPLVAGACALLLSKNPDLTEAQIRQVIVATADKVGQFPYANGRNDYMGNGRLNLLAAINAI